MFNNFSFFRKSCRLRDNFENILESDRTQMKTRRKSHAGYQRLQTHTQNMQYLLLFHVNSGCTNAAQCYVSTYVACLVNIYFVIL